MRGTMDGEVFSAQREAHLLLWSVGVCHYCGVWGCHCCGV